MAKLFFMLIFFAVASDGLGQKITMIKTFGGARFEMDTIILSPREVLSFLKDNPVAYDEFRKAKVNDNAAGVLGFSGGVLVAIPLATAIAGGKPQWGLAAVGAAMMLFTIPLDRAFKFHADSALKEYNKKFAGRMKPSLYWTGSGAKLVIRF
jgi:uncharacterized membrane protein YphA (DoxX/SURF4 family)